MSDDTANTAEGWAFVARSVAGLPDGRPLALRCMARAGMAAQDASDWVSVATAWAQDFDDPEIAAQCMAQAEDDAEDADDWVWIAGIWRESLQEQDDATRSLGEAEEAAQDYDDWLQVAKGWINVFQDTAAATRCIETAEDIADDTEEWVQVAKGWMEILQSSDGAVRCLEKAQDAAYGQEEIEAVEEAWRAGVPGLDSSIRNEGIRRLLDNPDVSDYLETFGMAVADHVNRQQAVILDLGVLTSSSTTQIGTWGAECVSERREGSYARYYTFTLPQAAGVTIDLKSEVDAYLYLVSGDAHDGDVLAEDDDGGEDTDSRIRRRLAAGTYAIEANTFNEEEAGAFTLQVSLADPM